VSENYTQFCDDFLVAVADEQEPPGLAAIIVSDVCERAGIDAQESWILLVAGDLNRDGFGSTYDTWDDGYFLINGSGLRRADEIRASKNRNLVTRFDGANWQKWGAIIAAAALIVYIIFEIST